MLTSASPDRTQMKRKPIPWRKKPAIRKVRMDIIRDATQRGQFWAALFFFEWYFLRAWYKPLRIKPMKARKLLIPNMPVSAMISI